MKDGVEDSRDELIRELQQALGVAEEIMAAQEESLTSVEKRAEVRHLVEVASILKESSDRYARFTALAPQISAAIGELESYRQKYGSLDQGVTDLSAVMAMLQGLTAATQRIDLRTEKAEVKPLKLLSEGVEDYLAVKRLELMVNGEESKYTKSQIRNAVNTFIGYAGDKPANEYKASDFIDFQTFLARVPTNWNKKPMFRGLTIREVAEKNSKLKPPLKTMTGTTIVRNYMTALRGCFKMLCQDEERAAFDRELCQPGLFKLDGLFGVIPEVVFRG